MSGYDVTVEPWIPVRMLTGESKKLSLLELFKTAHEIERLDRMNAMQEYSVYRFLALFLTAVYKPYEIGDVTNIFLDNKQIDMQKVDSYIEECRNEGVSFDLFDKKRPFLQSPFDSGYDSEKTIQSIAVLDVTRPFGNDAVHFDHTFIENASMSFDKAIINLLAAQIFCVPETEGKAHRPSNVNSVPPIFFIPKGANLFETLILSLWPEKCMTNIKSVPRDKQNIELWRNTRIVKPEKKVTLINEFDGMIFPARRILLIRDNENDTVLTKCYYRAGLNFIGYDSWNDFYVAYYYDDKKGRQSIKPSFSKELWRNIGTIYGLVHTNKNNQTLSVVGQYEEIMKEQDNSIMSMLSFGVVTNQASYLDIQRGEVKLDTRISQDTEKIEKIKESIQTTEEIAKYLRATLNDIGKKIHNENYTKSNLDSIIHNYYEACEKDFYNFSDKLAVTNTDEQRVLCIDEYKKDIRKNALDCFNKFCDLICSTLDKLMEAEGLKIKFMAGIAKKLNLQSKDHDNE